MPLYMTQQLLHRIYTENYKNLLVNHSLIGKMMPHPT
jgi:hypothetical protein